MKKVLLFGAAILTAMSMSAQIVKTVAEVCNYVDIEAEKANLTSIEVTSTTFATLENGTIFKGFQKSDGTETSITWNEKETYNTSIIMPETAGTLDTLIVGTMFRAGSGASIELGNFTTTADGNIQVYFQPNGDSDRGLSIKNTGTDEVIEVVKNGAKIDNIRPGYIAEFPIKAGTYSAGEIVIEAIKNTSNIFGINIENLQTSAIQNAIAEKISFNGNVISNVEGLNLSVYNVLGKLMVTSNGDIDMSAYQTGVYVVRAEGVKGAMKIRK